MQGLEKLIDLLKTGGWQSFFVAAALFGFLLLQGSGVIDTTPVPYLVPIVWLVAIVLLGVAAASLGDQIKLYFRKKREVEAHKIAEFSKRKAFIEDIPRLTTKERQIFGYLLAKNQKRFDADATGDHASNLIAKGYIISLLRGKTYVSPSSFPFEVADYVWEEIQARKDQFPYVPEQYSRGGGEKAPWIDINW